MRGIVLKTLGPLFPMELKGQPQDSLSKLEHFSQLGYGSVILLNHFSRGDIPRAIAYVMDNRILGKREILMPEAIHRHKNWYDHAGARMGITFSPIPIEDTLTYLQKHPELSSKYQAALTREGVASHLNSYLNQALDVLSRGGVIILFPQGGMRSSLENVTPAVSTLLKRADRADINKFTLIFLGLGIEGVKNYQEQNSETLNLFRRYYLTYGASFTKEEFIIKAQECHETPDGLTLKQLQLVAPPGY